MVKYCINIMYKQPIIQQITNKHSNKVYNFEQQVFKCVYIKLDELNITNVINNLTDYNPDEHYLEVYSTHKSVCQQLLLTNK